MLGLISIFEQHPHWPEVQKILFTLNQAGFLAYLAGGSVRDALLGKIPEDFDIATYAQPDEIIGLFPNSNKQGKAFGVVAVFFSKKTQGEARGVVEVSTFRKDGPYKDGRHPESVQFLSDKEDAFRRDFTINAIFYDVAGKKVVDYVKGQEDLQRKVICTVGEAQKRFQEDQLRILRAIRFAIQLDFQLDPLTEKTIFKMKENCLNVSKERLYEESMKMLKTGRFVSIFSLLKRLDFIHIFWKIPAEFDWDFSFKFWEYPIPSHLMKEKAFLWMQALFPFFVQNQRKILDPQNRWNKDFYQVLKKWRFPIVIIKKINKLFSSFSLLLDVQESSLAEKLKILNSSNSEMVLSLSEAYLFAKGLDSEKLTEIKKAFQSRVQRDGHLPAPLLSGEDLKRAKIPEDEKMARLLSSLYNRQLEDRIKNKEELLKFVKLEKSNGQNKKS